MERGQIRQKICFQFKHFFPAKNSDHEKDFSFFKKNKYEKKMRNAINDDRLWNQSLWPLSLSLSPSPSPSPSSSLTHWLTDSLITIHVHTHAGTHARTCAPTHARGRNISLEQSITYSLINCITRFQRDAWQRAFVSRLKKSNH